MKKVNLIVILFCYLITMIGMIYLPSIIPAHYSNGGIDRMGSKWELMVIPVVMTIVFLIFTFAEHLYIKNKGQTVESVKIALISLIVSIVSLFSQIKGICITFNNINYGYFRIDFSYVILALSISIIGLIIFFLDENIELPLNFFNLNKGNKTSKKILGSMLFLLGIILSLLTIFTTNLNLPVTYFIGILITVFIVYLLELRIKKSNK